MTETDQGRERQQHNGKRDRGGYRISERGGGGGVQVTSPRKGGGGS